MRTQRIPSHATLTTPRPMSAKPCDHRLYHHYLCAPHVHTAQNCCATQRATSTFQRKRLYSQVPSATQIAISTGRARQSEYTTARHPRGRLTITPLQRGSQQRTHTLILLMGHGLKTESKGQNPKRLPTGNKRTITI